MTSGAHLKKGFLRRYCDFLQPGDGRGELLHGAVEGYVLEHLEPGEEHVDGKDVGLHLGPVGEGGEVAVEGGLGQEGLEQLLHHNVSVDRDPTTKEGDEDHLYRKNIEDIKKDAQLKNI